ncbi:DENN domain-containing protein 3-like [Watersipora subatra]|uniref:DENN domain-containing protein 3-like n=1 Tax=Watersipora subatra TaxID=2589382 RepID=UPI00355C22F2
MNELKLKNLVDLVLVVGSDDSSGLELHPNQARPPPKTSETGDDGDDIALKLTDPEANYHAKVLQIFSSSLASYPHRGPDEQLKAYPQQLYIPDKCRHEDIVEEEEDNQVLRPATALISKRRSNFRHMSLAPGMSAHRALTSTELHVPTLSVAEGNNSSSTLSQLKRRQSVPDSIFKSKSISMRKSQTPEMPLNFEQISAICDLCYPEGFRCYEQEHKPTIISYVLTDLNGDRFYAVALTFYTKMAVLPPKNFDSANRNLKYNIGNVNSITYSVKQAIKVFIPCCVVLVTSYPYFDTLQRCLTEFYAVVQPTFRELDDHVKQLALILTNLPVPPAGGELFLTFQARKQGLRLPLHPATHSSRPVIDLNMSLVFSILSPELICTIISAILREERLVFVSSSYALLTLVQESIMNMLYPFRWQSMYVPVLHAGLLGLLEAPGYYVMGCHSEFLPTIKLVEGIVIVDLNTGNVTLSSSDDQLPPLPLKAAGSFCARIVDTEMNFDIYSAGKVIADVTKAKEQFLRRLNNELIDMSLAMMADLLGSVYDHVIIDQKFFNKATYLSSQPSDDQEFYSTLVETTMFKVFLRDVLSEESPHPWTLKVLEKEKDSYRKISRPTRSVQSTKKRSLIAIQFENSCKRLNLPHMLSLEQFQEDTILNLSALVGLNGSSQSSKAGALYVMGALHMQRGELTKALNNFGDLHNMDSTLFPTAAIEKVLGGVVYPEDIVDTVLVQHKSFYRDLLSRLQSQRKSYITDVKVDLESLPKMAVEESEFSKYAERLDLAVGREAISRLYQALSLGTGISIEPEHLKSFYESWKDNEASCRDMEMTLSSKHTGFSDFTVLKVSSALVRTDFGPGHVILTTGSVLLLKNGAKLEPVKQISRISNIIKLEVYSALVILKPVECLRLTLKGSSKPVNLFLAGESQNWKILLSELIGGKLISTNSRDSFLMQQAAQNTLLLDALISSARLVSPACLHSKDLDRAVDLLSFYSKEETKNRLLISCDATKDILLYKLNPNADELDNASVECLMYLPGVHSSSAASTAAQSRVSCGETLTPTVWCGMSNGKIRIFDAASWRLYPRYIQALDRVISLAYDQMRVWAGSFDHDIYVIENNPQAPEYHVLSKHEDYVVDLQTGPAANNILSGDITGVIFVWDTTTLEVLKKVQCPSTLLTSMQVVSHNEIWCCCKETIIKMTLNGEVLASLFYIDEHDKRQLLECFCISGEDIWAGCSQSGRLVVWQKDTEVRRAILPLDARGVSQIVAIGNRLYVGCKNNYATRKHSTSNGHDEERAYTKSKLYTVDANLYKIYEGLSAHTDSIRCMFAVSNHYVMTGSGSKEGKIAIWKHEASYSET